MEALKYDSDDDGTIETIIKDLNVKAVKNVEEDSDSEFDSEYLSTNHITQLSKRTFMMYDSDHDDSIIDEVSTESPTNPN